MRGEKDIEKALDNAGRFAVFDLMRACGWTGKDTPPKWVWWEAIRIVNSKQTSAG